MSMEPVFTVELFGCGVEVGQVSYRLQRDQRWRLLGNCTDLVEADFRTESPQEVSVLTPKEGTSVEIDGALFHINPESVFEGPNALEHRSRCFRHAFPASPSKDQLRHALASWNDDVDGILVLGVDGQFEMRSIASFDLDANDPSLVVRHDVFLSGHASAGPAGAHSEEHVENLYFCSLEGWLVHLQNGWTQVQAGYLANRTPRDIVEGLEELHRNWRPGI